MADQEDLLSCLISGEVDFVLIGGLAALAHGATLRTQDIDICCDFSADNLMRLQQALAGLHPVHRMAPAHPALELTPENRGSFENLYLDTDIGQLDCLGAVDGIGGFREVRENSELISLPAGDCRVLTLDALIRAKEAMDRPRDREAVIQLKAIRERLRGEGGAPPGP